MAAGSDKLGLLPRVLIGVLLGGQLVSMAWGREWWPFTCAPMFAQAASPDTITYEFTYLIHKPTGATPFRFSELGLPPMFYQRGFFGAFYGSADPRTPNFGQPTRDLDELERAVGTWMIGFSRVLAERRPDVWSGTTAISLVLTSHHPTGPALREVGRWERSTGKYTHIRFSQ